MSNTIIGRVLATEKNPTTIDDFTFWTDPELILNPFDIVKEVCPRFCVNSKMII